MSNEESKAQARRAARAERRAERRAARERRQRERDKAGLPASVTATPDDPGESTRTLLPAQQLRRKRVFELLESNHTELVACRERLVLGQLAAAPGTDAHTQISREIEAINDEIDDLRELSDELLRKVAPLDVGDDRLAQLEGLLGTARALADASAKAKALIGAATELLEAVEGALDS